MNTSEDQVDTGGPRGNGSERTAPTTGVRYGRMSHVGEFSYPPDITIRCGAPVVIITDRGIELGHQLRLTCPSCEHAVSREKVRAYAKASGADTYRLNNGQLLREASDADLAEWRHLQSGLPGKLRLCREFVRELGLDMKVVDAEHILGGERIIFYFMAEDRVDFRELVRRLAGEFQTRIEMRQVGARDEARLVADYETCGRECCCKNFLKVLKPINMAMAKLQKTTLDISKVSGRCGRLKCCLRFEHESYEVLERRLPRKGVRIAAAGGVGRVVDRQVLTQLVKIKTDEGRIVAVAVEDILETNLPEPPQAAPEVESPDNGARLPSGKASGTARDVPAAVEEIDQETAVDAEAGQEQETAATEEALPPGPQAPVDDPGDRTAGGGTGRALGVGAPHPPDDPGDRTAGGGADPPSRRGRRRRKGRRRSRGPGGTPDARPPGSPHGP